MASLLIVMQKDIICYKRKMSCTPVGYLALCSCPSLFVRILRSVRVIANCILTIRNTLSAIATLVITKGRSICSKCLEILESNYERDDLAWGTHNQNVE